MVLQLCQCHVAWPQESLKWSCNCPDTVRPEKLNFVLHRTLCYLRFQPYSSFYALTQSILVGISCSCFCSQSHCQQGYILTLGKNKIMPKQCPGLTSQQILRATPSPPPRSLPEFDLTPFIWIILILSMVCIRT